MNFECSVISQTLELRYRRDRQMDIATFIISKTIGSLASLVLARLRAAILAALVVALARVLYLAAVLF